MVPTKYVRLSVIRFCLNLVLQDFINQGILSQCVRHLTFRIKACETHKNAPGYGKNYIRYPTLFSDIFFCWYIPNLINKVLMYKKNSIYFNLEYYTKYVIK